MSQWFRETRLQWMRESIEMFGHLNREHIMRKFQVSPAQAALDLGEAQRRWPNHFVYNASTKRYEEAAA